MGVDIIAAGPGGDHHRSNSSSDECRGELSPVSVAILASMNDVQGKENTLRVFSVKAASSNPHFLSHFMIRYETVFAMKLALVSLFLLLMISLLCRVLAVPKR